MLGTSATSLRGKAMVQKTKKAPMLYDARGHEIEPLAVGISEAGRLIGIGRSSLYRELCAGRLQAIKAGKRTLLTMASLRAWLASLPKSKAA